MQVAPEVPGADIASCWDAMLGRLRNHLFERDVEPLRAALLRHCKRLTGDQALAEDLLQGTLERGFGVFCQICGGPVNAKAYLFRIATNLWIDQLRKQKRELALRQDLANSERPSRLDHSALDTLITLSQALTPREFEVFRLHELQGYTAAESARLLGTTEAAVKMAASRARRRMTVQMAR